MAWLLPGLPRQFGSNKNAHWRYHETLAPCLSSHCASATNTSLSLSPLFGMNEFSRWDLAYYTQSVTFVYILDIETIQIKITMHTHTPTSLLPEHSHTASSCPPHCHWQYTRRTRHGGNTLTDKDTASTTMPSHPHQQPQVVVNGEIHPALR